MVESYQICPYTGLRSFTEDESLYFKGREEDIDQATSQLQRNKFLMLTGASGDGKSSLVYAGIIPNARAGFLKSKYTQWCVVNFRPERTPFQNLCRSLARELQIEQTYTVQGELNHGFSALADLYRNSKRFIDTNSSAWLEANDKEKAVMKREAANLIILVDQFEEFFTNPENYQQGAPSKDSSLVLNLLLETARIALEEDLPVYVIFTMRSDYIGQCADFRGLPEYIGFSQFFVPRLNRTQLQQVIEEPAKLSGNRISRRLTERLIHDITEGVDQLPILQHALNQIWMAAGHGTEEMDLVHYAMAGGMSVEELPDEQVPVFEKWFNSLPAEIKACYHAPSLQNVLDTHTNKLYEQAARYYEDKTGKKIPGEDAKAFIRIAFTCLTKIDQGRPVRNRMTLQEITDITGRPGFDTAAAGCLLNIFREPGNTFIHPFITEDNPDGHTLQPEQVLDITHESLIRNWQYLGRWAKEEFDSYSISLDFEKQLGRWIGSNSSNNFLLAIGPLTYFESWFNKARPNAYWIARYLPENTGDADKMGTATKILDNSRQFLKRSARKHAITRTVMRYGTKRIAVTLGILALLVFSSFVIKNYVTRQNNYLLHSFVVQAQQLANDPKVSLLGKTLAITPELQLGQTTIHATVNNIPDTLQKVNVLNGMLTSLIMFGRTEPKNEIYSSLSLADSLFESLAVPQNDPQKLSAGLNAINIFRVVLELGFYYSHDPRIAEWRKRNAVRSARWVLAVLNTEPGGFNDLQQMNLALENAVNYNAYSVDELNQLLQKLSPFENGLQSQWLQSNYHRDKLMIRGSQAQNYGFTHNGLYQELAYLYAATGNTPKVMRCLDTLFAFSQNNFQGNYAYGADNACNIAIVFFRAGKTEQLDQFVKGYCDKRQISSEEFYARLLGRTQHGAAGTANLRLFPFMDQYQNLNTLYFTWSDFSFFCNKYREAVQTTIKDPNERNFLTALSYKEEGIAKSLTREQPGNNEPGVNDLFDKAVAVYQSVDSNFLATGIPIIDISGADLTIMPRKFLFVYPDLKTRFHPEEPRSFYYFYFGDAFLHYILTHHLFDKFYPGTAELSYISTWFFSYSIKNINLSSFFVDQPRYEVLKMLAQSLEKRHVAPGVDFNLLYLRAGQYAQDANNLAEMEEYYNKLEPANIFNILRTKDFGSIPSVQCFRMISYAVKGYIKVGKFDKAVQVVRLFKNPVNRSSLYAYVAGQLLEEKADKKVVQPLIDSARKEMNRVDNPTSEQPNRRLLAYALAMQDPSKNIDEAFQLIRNLPTKLSAIQNICKAFAFHNDLFNAQSRIPEEISGSGQAEFINNILLGYMKGKGTNDSNWNQFISNYPLIRLDLLQYIDESN